MIVERKELTKKPGQNEMVSEKTTLSSQAENANMRLHLA